MVNIAVLGYGTVGSGVVEVLRTNQKSINNRAGQDINLKYVLDLRDFPGDPVEDVLVHDYDIILNDEEVDIVVEVMGGINPAYQFVKNALLKGKSVCTSNKELVAKHGAELLEIAKQNNINFLFEASVGGGIPIIRPLNQSLTADEIIEISGILNGTTNFILTKMCKEGLSFDTVLKEAQDLGYAERNPEADVEGYDACRKIAILSSLACGQQVDFEDIYTEGITKVSDVDFKYAKELGVSIKLIGTSKRVGDGFYAMVSPKMISDEHPLAGVNGVMNAIFVKGNVLGTAYDYDLAFVGIKREDISEELLDKLYTVHIDKGYWDELENEPDLEIGIRCINDKGSVWRDRKGKLIYKSGTTDLMWRKLPQVTRVSTQLFHGASGSAMFDIHGNFMGVATYIITGAGRYESYCSTVETFCDVYEDMFEKNVYYQ